MGVDYIGPFRDYRLVVDGYRVPFLDAREVDGGQIWFTIDNRVAHVFPAGVADQVARFAADCIAVASGLGCHPSDDRPRDEMLAMIRRSPLHPSLLPMRMGEITAIEDADASPPESRA